MLYNIYITLRHENKYFLVFLFVVSKVTICLMEVQNDLRQNHLITVSTNWLKPGCPKLHFNS